jgi:tellurite resistance protein TerC
VAGNLDWIVFAAVMVGLMAVDIGTTLRGRSDSLRGNVLWSVAWIGLALAFGGYIAFRFGTDPGMTYLTAYAMEKSLSIDNLFVFALVFAQTGLTPKLQRRALFWGIGGALVMRALMIAFGVYLLQQVHWIIYVFAALLAFSAVRLLFGSKEEEKFVTATCSLCSSWIGRFIPISLSADGTRLFTRRDGRLMATPLLVALVAIEGTDLVFAIDSIPAVLAITTDPYLVYTSNIFALMGLRSLYFVLANVMQRLRFLRTGLALILLFAAGKMLLSDAVHMPAWASLVVVVTIFTGSVLASLRKPR